MTNSRMTDPEVLEFRYPVVVEEHSIRYGSGGQGKWNGGPGALRRVRFLETMNAGILSGHRRVPPYGMAGGGPGQVGRSALGQKGPTARPPSCSGSDENRVPARRRLRDPDADWRRLRKKRSEGRALRDRR